MSDAQDRGADLVVSANSNADLSENPAPPAIAADLMADDLHNDPRSAQAEEAIDSTPHDRKRDRIRLWRRRALLKHGARLHALMGTDSKDCSFAMLDEEGVVVSWYGQANENHRVGDQVVDRHVSQFYVPEDIASKQPLRDLRAAAIEGSTTRHGWQRRPDGIAFWGTSVIEAILLRDRRLQGFSYVTSACDGPAADVPIAQSLDIPRFTTTSTGTSVAHCSRRSL